LKLLHYRYRNPLFTAFAHKYEEYAEKKKAESATPQDPEKPVPAVDTASQSKRGTVRRRLLLAHTLRCNPQLAENISDQEASMKGQNRIGQVSFQSKITVSEQITWSAPR
jgi:hypothetical protein